MWKGSLALHAIDQSIQSIRNDVVRLDSQLNQLTANLGANKRHRAKLLNDIAKVRLSAVESGDLSNAMSAADKAAVDILQQRERAIEDLAKNIDHSNDNILKAEQQRVGVLDAFNGVSERITEVEAGVQQQLSVSAEYKAQLERAQTAESVAEQAFIKVQRSQEGMAEKAAPYQADALFMYLWKCGFGTSEYDGGLITRFVDTWLAKLIDFEPARVNYWNLEEIPKRLNEHAERVGDQADVEHAILQQLESDALELAGVSDLRSQLDQRRLELDAHDDSIEALEAKLNEQLSQRAVFVSGEDRFILDCLQRISSALAHKSMASIHRYVLETESHDDDHLLIELQDLDDGLDGIEDNIADVRKFHDKRFNRLQELEGVRRNFKNSRFDDMRSSFANQSLINGVLSQFVQGLVSGSDVWNVIKRNQRSQRVSANPSYGSGGLGEIADAIGGEIMRQGRRRRRSSRGSTWNVPLPRHGGSVFRAPRGGSGGGFKTGGGF